jgi:H+/Cl- antiporter ClcA
MAGIVGARGVMPHRPAGMMCAVNGSAYLRLVALGALIGIPAALVAALFLAFVHVLEDWLWTDSTPWYLVVGLPVIGAALVLAARTLLPGDGGHRPLEGIGGGPTPLEYGPGVALAALGSLAFGAVLGPEAPLIALGSIVGVTACRVARLGPRDETVLGTAGSFSAISALFGGPLVAGMLMLESGVGLGSALLPALLPGLVAAAVGYVLFVGLGDWGGLDAAALAVPGLPVYEGTRVLDLGLAILVGIVTALLVTAIRRAATRLEALQRDRLPLVLLGGGLAVGLLAQLSISLGASADEVLFSGQSGVPEILAEGSLAIILLVLAAKTLGFAICLGCGFRGGPVFPAIFLGVGIATLAVVALDVSPTLAVAVGAAAGMAAGTRLLFSSLLLAGLLVGRPGLDAIPAAVLAVAAAWLTVNAVDEFSRRRES